MEEALIDYLLNDIGLAAIVDNRVTWSARPQGTALPAIVLHVVDAAPVYGDEGDTGLARARVQIDCWADSYAEAKASARAVQARLSGARIAHGAVEFQGLFTESEQDLFERGQGGEELYRVSLEFMVWHS